jgi:hypothetical protein
METTNREEEEVTSYTFALQGTPSLKADQVLSTLLESLRALLLRRTVQKNTDNSVQM